MVCIFFKYLLGTFHVWETLASLKISRAFLFKYSMCVGWGGGVISSSALRDFLASGKARYRQQKHLRPCSVFLLKTPKAVTDSSEAVAFCSTRPVLAEHWEVWTLGASLDKMRCAEVRSSGGTPASLSTPLGLALLVPLLFIFWLLMSREASPGRKRRKDQTEIRFLFKRLQERSG